MAGQEFVNRLDGNREAGNRDLMLIVPPLGPRFAAGRGRVKVILLIVCHRRAVAWINCQNIRQ